MIAPTEKLRSLIGMYQTRVDFCKLVGLDEGLVANLLAKKRGASAGMQEKVCRALNWSLSDAWEIVEGEDGSE